jgi:hypothetical protein
MKTLYILNVIILFSTSGISQNYHPIIKNNKSWDQVYAVQGACWASCARYEFVDGETYINGVPYRNSVGYPFIGTYGPQMTLCPPYSISNQPNPFARMREDTLAKKVYIYDYNSTPTDQVLYDFTLNVGDTLHSAFAGQGDTLVLYSIETVSLANGELRQKFCFDAECITSYTEEIGGPNGLFLPIVPMWGQISPLLLCVQDEGVVLCGNECDIYFVGIESPGNEPLTIFPNPFQDRITITISSVELQTTLEIIDLQGNVILNQRLDEQKSGLALSGLNPGMYFYSIYSDKSISRGKLIKN